MPFLWSRRSEARAVLGRGRDRLRNVTNQVLSGVDDKVLAGHANVLPDSGLGRWALSGREI